MEFLTLTQIRTRVRREMDLLDEPGISDTEIDSYINEAIDVAESNIHTLYEDYFLTYANITATAGSSEFSMPTNIYANKIRTVLWEESGRVYEIKRITGMNLFERISRGYTFENTQDYRYFIVNNNADGKPRLKLVPLARENSTTNIKMYYIRNAAKLTLDADTCDIPEFVNFVVAYAKNEIAVNKPGLGDVAITAPKLESMRLLMVDTLTNMVPDENDQVAMDLTHYEDHT